MTVIDGGHGLGLHIEQRLGRAFVWMSLQGSSQKRPTFGGRLAVFRYSPGMYAIDAIPGGIWVAPQFKNSYGEYQESIHNLDWERGFAVERMFDFHTGHQERYTRRRITDIVIGHDRPFGQMTIPVNPPTLQGFTTVNDTFFRWDGLQNSASGQLVTDDPIMLEQYDWRSGARIDVRAFPTLGQDGGIWRDGAYEPEGMSVYRGGRRQRIAARRDRDRRDRRPRVARVQVRADRVLSVGPSRSHARVLFHTRFGTHLLAVGDNTDASKAMALKVSRIKLAGYVICGGMGGIGAVLLTSYIGSSQPATNTDYLLKAIAAVVLGGVSLFGGRATMIGPVIGAVLLTFLQSGLTLLGVSAFYSPLVIGIVVIAAAMLMRGRK